MTRARGYCFTINNPDEILDTASILELIDHKHFQYVIVGDEVGREGTHHYQCFVYFKEKVEFSKLKTILPRAHIESAKGTPNQAILYCMKDENYIELGERPKQGRRTDLEITRYDIKKKPFSEVVEDNYSIYCQYFRPMHAYATVHGFKEDTKIITYNNIRSARAYCKQYYPHVYYFEEFKEIPQYARVICKLPSDACVDTNQLRRHVWNGTYEVLILPRTQYNHELGPKYKEIL